MDPANIKLALVSCGLGNVNRGFEVSTARLYKTLHESSRFDVRLFTGGKYEGAKPIWNISRDELLRSPIGLFSRLNDRRFWEFSYGVEQVSFALSLLPELLSWRPDVIWTKEVPFGYFLNSYRAMFGLKYKVIFANGGAFRPVTYKDFDFIQHLQYESYADALEFGIPEEKMITLTNFLYFQKSDIEREQLRAKFGYTKDDWVVICVAAWNRYHKRIDYLINEVAALKDPRIKLMLCGHPEPDTASLRRLAQEKLGDRVKWLTLPEAEVHQALQAADVFVLPSIQECVGNAMAEAALAEIPIVCHSHTASRFVLKDNQWMADLSIAGKLSERLMEIKQSPPPKEKLEELHRSVHELFSAEALLPVFCDMVQKLHKMPPPSATGSRPIGKYDLRAEN